MSSEHRPSALYSSPNAFTQAPTRHKPYRVISVAVGLFGNMIQAAGKLWRLSERAQVSGVRLPKAAGKPGGRSLLRKGVLREAGRVLGN